MIKDLQLTWVKPAKNNDLDNSNNSGQYLDFIISGQSLKKYLGVEEDNSVTPLGWFLNRSEQQRALREFRLQTKSQLDGNRIELYICAECGDIGCGAITAQILDRGDRIIWRDFANQAALKEIGKRFNVEEVEFERSTYFKAFSQLQ